MPGFVYGVRHECPKCGWAPMKIGKSRRPDGRFRELQTASPSRLRMVTRRRVPNMGQTESAMHDYWAARHVLNEWYEIDEAEWLRAADAVTGSRSDLAVTWAEAKADVVIGFREVRRWFELGLMSVGAVALCGSAGWLAFSIAP